MFKVLRSISFCCSIPCSCSQAVIGPPFPRLKNVIAPVLLSCALIFWINKLTGCNFLFLNRPGHGNPLALFASYLGDPGYLAAIPLLFAAVWVLLYLPPYFAERGKKKLAPAAR